MINQWQCGQLLIGLIAQLVEHRFILQKLEYALAPTGHFDPKQTFDTHSFIWRDHGLDKLRGGNGCRANSVRSSKEELTGRTSFICWRIVIVKSKTRYEKINYSMSHNLTQVNS